ncbi:MAG TPA: alpha/beta fold hydrolase [Cyclobacteriaceae bacterium]|nr:alpha/beta fold hydrolase [Cyclobacteriaceae bacterium]
MNLFYRQSGEGQPLIILHGLFGSSDNWYTLAKVFAQKFTVFAVDQRNHGQSPHSPELNYQILTEDLKDFISTHAIQKPIILGHSMGGKTAMNFAVKYPEQLGKLIVVDIVPKKYPVHHDAIIDGLKAIPLQSLSSRNDADRILASYVSEPEVRQFLLKNLVRKTEGGFEWKINLSAIDNNIEALGEGLVYSGKYDGPSFFIKGKKSNYYREGDESLIQSIFTSAEFATLDTGHWVQAEKPDEFARIVLSYLER